MLRNFLFVLVILSATACAKRTTPSGSGSSGQVSGYSEDIRHLLPQYDDLETDGKAADGKETGKAEPVNVAFSDDNEKVNASLDKIIEHNKTFNNGQGFRIQVFSGNSRADFENAKSYLLRNFPQLEIYESYSQPTYRIRAGDFLYYQDAEKYSGLLRQRFGTTRIVNEKINIKKALNSK
ncbi:SPOR domain-containing protein [Leadbetterella sp. DM7]|uniref:SPOR domain-containing protein n=1 Tax=Leadbetterella sp. DM7 TaxID=3235085 RepID=UPI00349EB5D6